MTLTERQEKEVKAGRSVDVTHTHTHSYTPNIERQMKKRKEKPGVKQRCNNFIKICTVTSVSSPFFAFS